MLNAATSRRSLVLVRRRPPLLVLALFLALVLVGGMAGGEAVAFAPPKSLAVSTPPDLPANLDLTLVLVADPQLDSHDEPRIPALQNLGWAINHVHELRWPSGSLGDVFAGTGQYVNRPQAVVVLGDMTYGRSYPGYVGGCWAMQSWQLKAIREVFEPGYAEGDKAQYAVQYPSILVAGNHDLDHYYGGVSDGCGRKLYWRYIDRRYANPLGPYAFDPFGGHAFSWDAGGAHLVNLQRYGGDTDYDLPSSLQFLGTDLALNSLSGRPVILFQHYGWDDFGRDPRWWGYTERARLNDTISGYNVIAAFHGHTHADDSYTHAELAGGSVPIYRIKQGLAEEPYPGQPLRVEFVAWFAVAHITDRYIDLGYVRVTDDRPVSLSTMSFAGPNHSVCLAHAPVLSASAKPSLTPIRAGTANPPGDQVDAIIPDGAITDADGVVKAMAITGADNSHGTWQYSLDGGTIWKNLESPSQTWARLLGPTDRLRFLPAPGFSGQATLTFRAWDLGHHTVGGAADTTHRGGCWPFSTREATVAVDVLPLADLHLTQSALADPVAPGADETYTIIVLNAGPSASPAATLSAPLSPAAGFKSLVAPSGWSCTLPAVGESGNVRCTGPGLAASESATFRLTVTVGAGATGTLSSTAQLDTEEGVDPDLANNRQTTTVTIRDTAATVYVDDGYDASTPGWGETHFSSIQSGIAAVADNGLVVVHAGTYSETVTLDRGVAISLSEEATVAGDLALQAGRFTVAGGNLTVRGNLTVTGNPEYRLRLLTGGLTVDGDLTIGGDAVLYAPAGSIAVRGNLLLRDYARFYGDSAQITLGGNLTQASSGAFDHRYGSITFNGHTTITSNPSSRELAFPRVTIAAGAVVTAPVSTAPSSKLRIDGDFTVDGEFRANQSRINVRAYPLGTATIGGAAPITFHHLELTTPYHASGGRVVAPSVMTITGRLEVGCPTCFDPNQGAVIFSGNAEIVRECTLHNVQVTAGSSVKGSPELMRLHITGDLTNAGTFAPYRHNADGTVCKPCTTVTLDGTGPQSLHGTGTTAFGNLTIANPTGVTLEHEASVGGQLTLNDDLTTSDGRLVLEPDTTCAGAADVVGNIFRAGLVSGRAYAFGNPNVRLKFDSGVPPADVTVNLAKASPLDFAGAVSRTYTITPQGGLGYAATARLAYQDADLAGNEEGKLAPWRYDGTRWQRVPQSGAEAGANWIEAADVTAFSRWTLATAGTTTAVSSLPNPSEYGRPVTLSAQVVALPPAAGIPTGTVSFRLGEVPLEGCAALALDGSGCATCDTSELSPGTHNITAVYSGGGAFAGSSGATSQLVRPVLAIDKTDGRDTRPAGSNWGYTIVVTNTRPLAITGLVVTDTLPAQVHAPSLPAGAVRNPDGSISWHVGDLDANTSVTLTLPVSTLSTARGAVTNVATASCDGSLPVVASDTTDIVEPPGGGATPAATATATPVAVPTVTPTSNAASTPSAPPTQPPPASAARQPGATATLQPAAAATPPPAVTAVPAVAAPLVASPMPVALTPAPVATPAPTRRTTTCSALLIGLVLAAVASAAWQRRRKHSWGKRFPPHPADAAAGDSRRSSQ